MTSRAPRARALARAFAAVAMTVVLTPAAAFAAQAATTTTTTTDPESLPIAQSSPSSGVTSDAGGTLARFGIGLVVVLGVIGIVWYVLKRIRSSRYPEMDARGSSLIDVLSTTPLGPNRNLHLVRIGDELVVLGATEQSITPVTTIDGHDATLILQDLLAPDARGAFSTSAGPRRSDARFRATSAPVADATVLDRLRALTTRR